MVLQIQHTRLTEKDDLELTRCLTRLNAIHDSVNATGMAGKAAIMLAASEVYHVIEGLLAREQAAVQRYLARKQQAEKSAGGEEV